ncbi:MAG: hypothetical protein JO092_10700 [Candidatus Eremiobacteraeota bacterium]|nr:hypothetical protein [Candidatus Eremiobacteraeota bacterium]
MLPFDSSVIFVLDEPISSKSSKSGDLIAVHLKDALTVGGRIIAPAGTPAKLRITNVQHAGGGDVYGFVDIFFEPLVLPDGRTIPLRAPVARLSPRNTSGHESTVEFEDTVGDIFVPYYVLWQIMRKGKNFTLKAGSELPARTEATLTAMPNGIVAIQTPRPPQTSTNVPKSSFPVEPEATPFGPYGGAKQAHATPSPTPWPSPPTPSPSPSPSA